MRLPQSIPLALATRPAAAGSAVPATPVYVVLVALLNTILWFRAPSHQQGIRGVLASAILWVATYPTLAFLRQPRKEAPIFPAINLAYFVYFALPVFLDTVALKGRAIDEQPVTVALTLTLVGLLALQLCFFTPLAAGVDALPRLPLRLDVRRLVRVLLFMAVMSSSVAAYSYLFTFVAKAPGAWQAAIGAAQRVPFIFLGALQLAWLRGHLTRWEAAVWAIMYALLVICSIASGAIALTLLAIAPGFFVYVAERGRLPWAAALIAALVLLPFLHTKHAFRREVRDRELIGFQRVPLFVDIAWNGMTSGANSFEKAAESSSRRMSQLASFALVVKMTPAQVPFNEGKSYETMLWSFVPRVIAPDKPAHVGGQDFGHRYGFLERTDYATAVNLPQIAEMYMNFGSTGVVFGMALLGLFYRAVYRLFNHGRSDGILVLGASTLVGLLNVESEASAVISGGMLLPAWSYLGMLVVVEIGERFCARTLIGTKSG